MKFLCDNCKAKYQISDDKVAGKTVRMKCRKCGHQIEVRAAVTETSVSVGPPRPDVPRAGPSAPGPAAGAPPAPKRSGLATSLSSTARPQTQKMSRPETGALAGAFTKSVKDDQAAAAAHAALHGPVTAKSYSSQPPSNLDMLDVSMTEEWYVAINGVPVGPIRVSELRRKAAGGAIHDDSLCWQEGLEEWRPVKAIPELARIVREAAMSGRPSLTSNNERPSQTPPPPQAGTGMLVPSGQQHQAQHAHPQAPRAPARPATGGPMAPAFGVPRPLQTNVPMHSPAYSPAPSALHSPFGMSPQASPLAPVARNNVVPISGGRLATAERLDEAVPAALLFAPPPPPAPMLAHSPAPPAVGVSMAADPFAATPPPPAYGLAPNTLPGVQISGAHTNAGMMIASASPSMAPAVPQKRGTPIWAIAAIVFAGCFGIAVAVMVFMPKTPAQQPVTVQTSAPTAQGSVDPSAALAVAPPPSAATDPSASAGKVATPSKPGGAIAAGGSPTPHTGADLKGLLGGGPGGPNDIPVPVGGGPSGGSSTGLDGAAVQNVVRQKTQFVRRKCWDTGGTDQKPAANVQVAVTVAPNGSVTNAVATGDEPVATCIAREVKNWTFPAPGSTTTVNIPFHFVRQ